MIVAPDGPVDPDDLLADAPVNVTVPKFANGTSPPFSSKSSTIHSASCSHSADDDVIDCVTVWPVVRFSILAWPALVDDAVTVRRTLSPERKLMPEKSYA